VYRGCSHPRSSPRRLVYGLALMAAVLAVQAAWAAAPSEDDWRARGTVAFRAGDLDAALAAFARAAVAQPDDPVLWNNTAVVLWRLGANDVARLAVSEALALRTPYPEAIANQRHFAGHPAPPAAAFTGEVRFLRALLTRRHLARATASAPAVVQAAVPVKPRRGSEPGPPLGIETAAEVEAARPVVQPLQRMVERYDAVRADDSALLPPAIAGAGSRAYPPPPDQAKAVASGARRKAPIGDAAASATVEPSSPPVVSSRAAVPAALVHLADGAPDVLVVDKQAHRLYHYRGMADGPQRVADYACVIGKAAGRKRRPGDLRTPEGVYFLEDRMTDAELAPRYGVLAYPTDYPNSFDRLAGRRGAGIWLHGTDDPGRLTLRDDSRGCIVLANEDLLALSRAIRPGRTPVVVVTAIQWVGPEAAAERADRVNQWLDGWRREWEEGDLAAYRARYGAEFFRLARTRPSTWLRRKQEYLREEGRRQIEFAGVTILRSGDQLVVVCGQTYRSPRHNDTGIKRIYLAADGPAYHIVDEKWLPAG